MYPLSAAHISADLVFDLDEQLQRANCCAVHVVPGPNGPALVGINWPTPQLPLDTKISRQIPPITAVMPLIHHQLPSYTADYRHLALCGVGGSYRQIPAITLRHRQLESFLHAEQLAARVNALAGTGDSERAAIMCALLSEAAR